MPKRIQSAPTPGPLSADDAVAAYLSALDADFTDTLSGIGFPSRAAAERAWPTYRRAVWAQSYRMRIPSAALEFDRLTYHGWQAAWGGFCEAEFPLSAVLAALDVDRTAVAAFERRDPAGAGSVADYLRLWRADLDVIEQVARELAMNRYGGACARLSTSRIYGDDDTAV